MDGPGKDHRPSFTMPAGPQSPQPRTREPTDTGEPQQKSRLISPPSISLPRGGGAIRGIDEKFGVNPVTGTGSLSVPIYASPGRSGFGPQLSLSYDSGAGNGPFGFGWSLALPAITRKTDKGLPRYRDAEESDVFILSGAEDLVPVLVKDGEDWKRDAFSRTVDGVEYHIQRYRPRIEGLFARIERWTNVQSGEIHWRSISKDNTSTLYGKTPESRVTDLDGPLRVFSWLICESFDDKGNAIRYEYKPENSQGVDVAAAHERNRTEATRSANRYLKRIQYCNQTPCQANEDLSQRKDWLFELVFDYGEHYREDAEGQPTAVSIKDDQGEWTTRQDPISAYRAGFEVRTYRLCQRVLMFHHFPDELGVEDYLVRSTEFQYEQSPIASFITSISQSGYVLRPDGTYLKRSLPPLELTYSKARIQNEVKEIDPESLENLPIGLDGASYRWVDLDGEGISGILTEQADTWYYKPNLGNGRFGPLRKVAEKPSLAALNAGQQQLLDLAGDGELDLVQLADPTPGFYERTHNKRWETFRLFTSRPNLDWDNPNLRFVDLTGDGHADILITENQAFTWYSSLAEMGFASGEKVRQALDEEIGLRLVFADGTQSIYLADISGDGLTDLARIRNGEVCYWPNLGYGRFGAKVTMDHAPWFDHADQFSQQRIRLADIDGSGTTDILYLGNDGIDVYRNETGNRWSQPERLTDFPHVDNLSSITALDLLGNGTACLVWSSPLPGDTRRPMRYIDLMGGQKPHLLRSVVNNLGAETHVHYAASTKFYLADEAAGKPWITRLPFPVHVVERVETYDRISRNRFVTRYAYHHGYFDGIEREFRGFGLVEQWDTEEFAALTHSGSLAPSGGEGATNIDATSHVPPVLTKTWFHTGAYLGRNHVSDFFAGLLDGNDTGEYYREPGLTDQEAAALGLTDEARHRYDDQKAKELLLRDTILPEGLTAEEEREACRALKGSMLRQEVYALDGTDMEQHPYTVTEQNFTIEVMQPRDGNQNAVFFTHAREAINYHYERNPADPRISHAVTLEVDAYGNVLKEIAIGYGRRNPSDDPAFTEDDKVKQTRSLITYTENSVTNPIDNSIKYPDDYRTPLPSETRTYELTGFKPKNNAARFSFDEWSRNGLALLAAAVEIPYEQTADNITKQKRLIEQVRTLYRKDDLTALLPLGEEVEPLALPGESYTLAFTPGLLAQVFTRRQTGQPDEPLLPADPAKLLGGKGADEGGYVAIEGNWWIPTGQVFYSDDPNHSAIQEKTVAQAHFYLPRRYRDPFGYDTVVAYDGPADPTAARYDLLVIRTTDALGNTVTAANDYRVLQPRLVTDPNLNRTAAAFDALGLAVATAVMGKETENLGDLLEGFDPDPPLAELQAFAEDPRSRAASLLGKATTRVVYDLERYKRAGQPPFAATLARETHFHEPSGAQTRIQIGFTYSDGFGREIQKKIQAEAGKAPQRQVPMPMSSGDIRPGKLARDVQGALVNADTTHRWVGTGRTVFNNKGKPVLQYEPFFSATHLYEPEREMTDSGVSPVLFYDPLERVVTTLHPNHTYEKVCFDPWQQTIYDVNDTVAASGKQTGDPRTDPDTEGYVSEYFKTQPASWQTWYAQRIANQLGAAEGDAAKKAADHADTPTIVHLDVLGRPFLTLADNGPDPAHAGQHLRFATRVVLDIEGNQRAVIDAKGRLVMTYDYDIAGPQQEENPDRIHQASMEAGERWMLNDVAGNPIYAWDSRGHQFRTEYDELRRPILAFVKGADPQDPNRDILYEKTDYGEGQANDTQLNLRTRVFRQYDGAGIVTNMGRNPVTNQDEAYDFKGNLLQSSRQLAAEFKTILDWLGPVPPEGKPFTTSTEYDALNRPISMTTPDNSVIRPAYNEANLLEHIEANLRGSATVTTFVENIDYDAKGQRTSIEYGNGVKTQYEYDQETFRLIHLFTSRGAAFPSDCPNTPNPPCGIQNLHYTYDPAGNITHIRDDAQQTIFFKNQQVDPSAEYTYDATYRLIEAKGREHLGQTASGSLLPPTPTSHTDSPRAGPLHSGDGKAMGRYIQQYVYDEVGNFLEMVHRGTNPVDPAWKRSYGYNEPSLLEPGKNNNRLSSTKTGNDPAQPYTHDDHGNMSSMPHLSAMRWDFQDQLQSTAQQVVGNGTPETTYYVYDADGERVRKVTERQAPVGQTPTRMKERIYLGGFETYREYEGGGTTVELERETLHVMDDEQRIALVETQTQGVADSPKRLTRYQLGDHLGSASLELSHDAKIISYEEYYPYGGSSYQAVWSHTETPKRYRYAGKERDEESGLNYHGARYCANWLGRWTNCDIIAFKILSKDYNYSPLRRDSLNYATNSEKLSNPRSFHNDLVFPVPCRDYSQGTRAELNPLHGYHSYTLPACNLYLYSKNNPVVFLDRNGMQEVYMNPHLPVFIREGIASMRHLIAFHHIAGRLRFIAGRFQERSGLPTNEPEEWGLSKEKTANVENASYKNAFRHAFYQALITKEFGREIATKFGYAHEKWPLIHLLGRVFSDPRNPSKALDQADTAADLLNNEIGRQIAENNPTASNRDLALKILEEFEAKGLFVGAFEGGGSFSIKRRRIATSQYEDARKRVQLLTDEGYNKGEVKKLEAMKASLKRLELRRTVPERLTGVH